MFKKIVAFIIIFFGVISFAQSETSWIKKKNKSEKIEKVKKEEKTSSWIKKKVKENKKEYKTQEKKITKEVKSWIKKKSKDQYLESINDLPDDAIYFTSYNENRNLNLYGYVLPDTGSELVGKFYKTSKGFGFFDDGKTTCKIGSTILDVSMSRITARVSGECTNGVKFTGISEQENGIGFGTARTKDGKNKFSFDFGTNKLEIANLYEENKSNTLTVERQLPRKNKEKILLKPNGKYYALLIGNSKYTNGWSSLVSPVNDVNSIKAVLDEKYNFKKILKVENGTKKDIYEAFQELSKLTTTNDYVLIYYSGHGQVKAQQAYWIPTDGSINWGNGDWINISEIDIFLTEIKAHHLAVLVDSCFVGSKFKGMNIIDDIVEPNEDDSKKYAKSMQSALDLRSRSVLSSGTTGEVSDTVKGTGHSRFALSIINQLNVFNKKSYPLGLEQMALYMKINYTKYQKPFMYFPDTWQHGGGNFVFIPKKNLK